jgi:hypothetical protein
MGRFTRLRGMMMKNMILAAMLALPIMAHAQTPDPEVMSYELHPGYTQDDVKGLFGYPHSTSMQVCKSIDYNGNPMLIPCQTWYYPEAHNLLKITFEMRSAVPGQYVVWAWSLAKQ